MRQSYGLVMTVMEPRALLLTNLAWHLGTGASEIHVYFDAPDDPVIPEVAALERVHVVVCDDAHWRKTAPIRRKPPTIRRRQALNANHALSRCTCDWLIHLDADEFLFQSRPLEIELAHVAELDCEIVFPVFERMLLRDRPQTSFFDGNFRSSTKGLNRRNDGINADKVIFGDHYPLLVHGMLGHSAGKCGVPRNSDFEIGIHWAYRGPERIRAARYASTSTQLLHFDGLTRLHWLSKLLRYADYDPAVLNVAPHRRAQIEVLLDVKDDASGILEFHREVQAPDVALQDRLRAFGLLHDIAFDPSPVIADVLGELPDLAPRPFDETLLAQYPERLAILRNHLSE
ncbi:glycosyltransferase family 2 protein [Primorskyibacter sp. S187A]|uniref:glycosyltransferase family 2 protein n=1 Tax=Primorskyibacter sp. S187A TaxID=3415130 RepID=UPI003C7CFAA9